MENVDEYQKIVNAEWDILYEKLDRITKSGAKVVLSKLPIGDVATQVGALLGCWGYKIPKNITEATYPALGFFILRKNTCSFTAAHQTIIYKIIFLVFCGSRYVLRWSCS